MASQFRSLVPAPLRRTFRLFQHNRLHAPSLSSAARQTAKGIGSLDYPAQNLLFTARTQEQLEHLRSCRREPETVRWVEEFCESGDVFYDVGANVGAFSFVAARTLGKGGRVYAFEPSFSTYDALCRNIELNHFDGIFPFPVALAERTDVMYFQYASTSAGHAHHALSDKEGDTARISSVFTQPVLSYALDDFVSTFRLPPPAHIKIDVDGEEARVIAGAKNTLASAGLKSLLIEIDERLPESAGIRGSIESAGFIVHSKNPRKQKGMYNYIFSRS